MRTDAIIDEYLDRVRAGETDHTICELPHMPERHTVRNWRLQDADFFARCSRARKDAADSLADEALKIARSATDDGAKLAAVQVAALQWQAAKRNPAVYGEKLAIDLDIDDARQQPDEKLNGAIMQLLARVGMTALAQSMQVANPGALQLAPSPVARSQGVINAEHRG